MNREIERKYLVKNDSYKHLAVKEIKMAQGYLCTRRVTARIRITDSANFLTIKNKSHDGGLSRGEWEWPIPKACAEALLARCNGIVEKSRFLVPYNGHTIEVDEFKRDNQGLVIAEIELDTTEDHPSLPDWIKCEVTGIRYFHNSYLSHHPFNTWDKDIINDFH